jgi:NADH:ubiquinone oxidoreductase subunit E
MIRVRLADMSLPTAGAPRPPTHEPLSLDTLTRVATKLEDALQAEGEERLTPEVVENVAADLGVPELHVYAAAATLTEIPCDVSAPVRFELCLGGCQAWGACELLDHLLLRHAERRDDDKPNFGIVVKRCLDRCQSAPVVFAHSDAGSAGLPQATTDNLDEAIEQLLDYA